MGNLHNELRRGMLGPALSRALGLTKGTEGLERVGETLTPTIDLWSDPSWAYLRGEPLLSWTGLIAEVAGEYSGAGLVLPVGCGTLIILERCTVSSAASTRYYAQRATAAQIQATFLVDGGRGNQRDTRWQALFGPGQGHVWSGSDAAFFGVELELTGNAGVNDMATCSACLPLIISPGNGFLIQPTAANQALYVTFGWRERKALPGELE